MSVTQGPITCPADCEDLDIPSVLFTECDPETNLSQIAKIYLAKSDAADFSDWTVVTEWNTRLSSTATDPDTIRPITVIGDKPLPEVTEKTISGGRIVVTGGKQVINFDIDETNATNHEFARGTKCVRQVKFWFETIDGVLFGGNTGISGTLNVNMVLSRTEGDIILYPGTLKWNSADVPERTTSPIA